ncbi:MAG: biotin/lipoate A/B protein ligase family protein [Chthoniobacterales bacterium]
MLFERLLVLDDREPAGAALNMAIDEALLESCDQPIVRFYGWRRPSLSFGYFGKFDEVVTEATGRELVRRWTGGGSVPHGDDLTYSLVTPTGDPVSTQGPSAIYSALHQAIRAALFGEGRETELAEAAAPKFSDACFANPVRDDLLLQGRKVAGAAQRRTRAGFLHQGSIQLTGLSESFRSRFAGGLTAKVEQAEMSRAVLQRATELATEKYATEAWLRRW